MFYLRLLRDDKNYFRFDWREHYLKVFELNGRQLSVKAYDTVYRGKQPDFSCELELNTAQLQQIQSLIEQHLLDTEFRSFGKEPEHGDQIVRFELIIETETKNTKQIYRTRRHTAGDTFPGITALDDLLGSFCNREKEVRHRI